MHRTTITVVDLASGKLRDCASRTMTFDVPADFDRSACVATVDAHARAHYLSTTGSNVVNPALPRPLSWRARGEQCLVAGTRDSANETPYRLCAVDPATR